MPGSGSEVLQAPGQEFRSSRPQLSCSHPPDPRSKSGTSPLRSVAFPSHKAIVCVGRLSQTRCHFLQPRMAPAQQGHPVCTFPQLYISFLHLPWLHIGDVGVCCHFLLSYFIFQQLNFIMHSHNSGTLKRNLLKHSQDA